MSLELTPSLIRVNGRFVENYERQSRASDEAKRILGISADADVKAAIGIASIEEVVTAQTYNLAKDTPFPFELIDLGGTDLRLESLVIANPDDNVVLIEVKDSAGAILLEKTLDKHETPYSFGGFPVAKEGSLTITTDKPTSYVQLSAKPVIRYTLADFLVSSDP